MAQFDPTDKKLTSGFVVGDKTIYIEAAKISTDTYGVASAWPSTTAEMSTNSGFVPTIGAVESEIKSKISTVYKVMGTTTAQVDSTGAITGFDPEVVKENGNVYNVALPTGVTNATLDGQEITNGDNIVYVSADNKWDKLAGSIDVTKYATKEWVNDGSEDGSLPMQMISGAYATSADMTDDGAREDALVTNAGIQDYVQGYISDNTLKTAEAISGIDESTSGMLVNAGAITGYIYDQIQTTIQETIDIAGTLTSGMDATSTPAASAVPNASAVTGYIRDITLKNGAAMTAVGANPEAPVSNSAVKEYVAEQLTDSISAYAGIIVNDTSAAADGYDTFKMIDGDGVALTTATDAAGNPTIKFNSNIVVSGSVGTAATSALLTVTSGAEDGVVNYDISVPDATTAKVGVVRADYYSDPSTGDGLIHLF